jgi:hypothetical protein
MYRSKVVFGIHLLAMFMLPRSRYLVYLQRLTLAEPTGANAFAVP